MKPSISVDYVSENGYQTKALFGLKWSDLYMNNFTATCLSGTCNQHPIFPEIIDVANKLDSHSDFQMNLNAIDMTERIRYNGIFSDNHAAFPLGQPDVNTGLWPYPNPEWGSNETVYNSSTNINSAPDWPRRVFTLNCSLKCNLKRIRSLIIEDGRPVPHNLSYAPLYSAINFKSLTISQSIDLDVNKPWIGTYGANGTEFVMLRYANDPSGNTTRPCVVCNKITGDVNIPRGEVTFWAYIDTWFNYMGDNLKLEDSR